jgi:hypothetical protein
LVASPTAEFLFAVWIFEIGQAVIFFFATLFISGTRFADLQSRTTFLDTLIAPTQFDAARTIVVVVAFTAIERGRTDLAACIADPIFGAIISFFTGHCGQADAGYLIAGLAIRTLFIIATFDALALFCIGVAKHGTATIIGFLRITWIGHRMTKAIFAQFTSSTLDISLAGRQRGSLFVGSSIWIGMYAFTFYDFTFAINTLLARNTVIIVLASFAGLRRAIDQSKKQSDKKYR